MLYSHRLLNRVKRLDADELPGQRDSALSWSRAAGPQPLTLAAMGLAGVVMGLGLLGPLTGDRAREGAYTFAPIVLAEVSRVW